MEEPVDQQWTEMYCIVFNYWLEVTEIKLQTCNIHLSILSVAIEQENKCAYKHFK